MNRNEIRERMPDVAAGFSEATLDDGKHLETCGACADALKAMRSTMAVLDEWQVPEPSPFFDVRFQARLREEMAKPAAGWLYYFRRPVMAAALTVILGLGVGMYVTKGYQHGSVEATITEPPGTAVSDLQALENNHDMYSDFDMLDDLTVQQDVAANP
jgi:predicted anti-sigma-YlaC factor YlaD